MASSSSSWPLRIWTYRVFASFHGPDVRKTFLSHLREQFNYNGITMFDDQGIERSQTIAPALTRAINESRIAIVVLSKNYASSSWCLDELVEILKCKEDIGQIVMTVFYEVDPSDVRKQTGEFGRAFDETCARKTEEERRKWSQALNYVGNIAGEHFLNWTNEAKMIEKIARDVSDKVNATPSRDFDDMVGLEAHLRKMQSLLDLDNDGVMMVAIRPGGEGKPVKPPIRGTQIYRAGTGCNIWSCRHWGSYPIGFDEYGFKLRLQEELLSKILNQNGMRISHLGVIQERLCDMKVLIILDDVNDVKQLEALVNENSWFGPGSRIIVTTENKEILQPHGIDNVYNVGFPSDEEALKILCRYAFKQSSPRQDFLMMAKWVATLCGNLPLGLRVVGSSLHGKNEDEWKYIVRRLETIMDGEIEEVLRVGYESLHENEQTLFLHIAVFFNYEDGDLVKAMLADNNLDIEHGLKFLINKSLIDISRKGEILMHNLLQQMGRQAIRRQEPWKRRILIDAQEICDVLENNTGTRGVSGISFDTSGIDEIIVSDKALRKMSNLRFLSVYKTTYAANVRMHIPEEMDYLPPLRLLRWEAYPSKNLPLRFCPENLVELSMEDSQLKKLWEGTQLLTNLKKMDLSRSLELKELPDLSNATNLETLELSGCTSLVELPSSIANLQKLEDIMMNSCQKLEVIPTNINLTSLKRIHMAGCSRLASFPNFSTNITALDISDTSVDVLPALIVHWSHLYYIDIRGRGKYKNASNFPGCVGRLDLSYTDVDKIPDCIKDLLWLQRIYLSCCRKLTSLPELPNWLLLLIADNCELLERVTFPINSPNAELIFTNCFKLDGETRKLFIQQSFLSNCLPGRVMPSEFNHRAKGNSVMVRLSSASLRFRACIIVSHIQDQHRRIYKNVKLQYRIIGKSSWSIHKMFLVGHPRGSPGIRRKHLCIFHGDFLEEDLSFEVSSELLFEFRNISDLYTYEDCEIIECGVRILTNEVEESSDGSTKTRLDQVSEDDNHDWSYDSELSEVLEDSEGDNMDHTTEVLISCDSKSGKAYDEEGKEDNVQGKEHTNCWSWLFLCFE
ncbi:Winged helix DNA-binding domain superfamily [Arabidopsis thaliana x Arabidopsis arenosa]|uniref:ADP-ribosyl cyclase/cyclic ADP-ribose hydrolase n=1 Tax=Arabidopsis thaliana x Arabidopsis arenosa TaxID=1240361 RepID=A0A8T2BMN9_9BRAS|nr:Winged helix DNA-binding domain superfamily [Arabidopsis thaliana x Arabidopsis arenosa]